MKRMSKPDIKQEALRKYSQYIAHYGMRNGKMIIWEAYKLFRKEEIRRKEIGKGKK